MKTRGVFPINDGKQVVLLEIDGNSDAVEAVMEKEGFSPAGSDELGNFNRNYPDVFLDCLIVALGEKGEGDGGQYVVPCLNSCAPGSSLRSMHGESRKRSWPTWTLFVATANGKHV